VRRLLAAFFLLAACGSGEQAEPTTPALPEIDLAGFQQVLAELERPAVVNVWASWCLPCRAEAPLLREAHAEFHEEIAFIGIDYNDSQRGARLFLDEFDLPFTHYFDHDGVTIAEYGGIGVPRTYFFAAGGELVTVHNGAIDEQTLALQIDELLNR
jgi:cytochrome c biogenesis protein CcmG/thiol:disulfide interchange protein DsbE